MEQYDRNFFWQVFITVFALLIAWWIIGGLHMSVISAVLMMSYHHYRKSA